MARSVFFWIVAVLSALFGALMFLVPGQAASQFGMTASADTDTIFRVLGATLLSVGLLNFLVRNHRASETLRAVLWMNISIHGLGTIADLWSVASGDVALSSVAIGFVSHAVIGLGSAYFLWRMEPA
ncbi:MAG: hypothetical protein ABI399_00225 [Bauldia sp.]